MITAIGFSGGWRPGQLIIQAATCDPSAHCFVVVDGKVIDATYAHGVKERKLSEVQAHWMEFIPARDLMTISQSIRLEIWLRDQLGKPYDTGWVLGYPFFGRQWQDDNAWCCSELIGAGLVAVGALEVPRLHRLTPRNLRRRIESLRR